MKLPKFIITMDGVFRLGMVDQHKHLLKPGDQCIGGGYYHFDFVSNRIILDRESYDFRSGCARQSRHICLKKFKNLVIPPKCRTFAS